MITYLRTEVIDLGSLTPYPDGSRRGDVLRVRESLRKNGRHCPLVVRQTPDDRLVVLAGDHIRQALVAEGLAGALCEIIECDDAAAERVHHVDTCVFGHGDFEEILKVPEGAVLPRQRSLWAATR